ncbi:MAG: hypothetical protein FWD26_04275 [Treponema sp.]|nr:hypothetical protein [Treponema sp.]
MARILAEAQELARILAEAQELARILAEAQELARILAEAQRRRGKGVVVRILLMFSKKSIILIRDM